MTRNLFFLAACVLLLALPGAADAAKLVEGLSSVEILENGYLTFNFTVAGPVTGPLKVGVLTGRRLKNAEEIYVEPARKGEFRSLAIEVRGRGRSPAGSYKFAVDSPKGRIGTFTATIVRGDVRESFSGTRVERVQTYFEKRERMLPISWIDDTGEKLALEFYIKVGADGNDALRVLFKNKGKPVCSDNVYAVGSKGEVVMVRAYCRMLALEPDMEDDGVFLDDDSHWYESDKDVSGDVSEDVEAGEGNLKDAMDVAEAAKRSGPWVVEVTSGKRRKRRIISFSAKGGEFRGGLAKRAPMKRAKVKVLAP